MITQRSHSLSVVPQKTRPFAEASLPNDLSGQIIKAEPYPFCCGGFSDIWAGQWNAMNVACKVLKGPSGPSEIKKKIQRESRIWSSVHHPNILPFYGVSFDFYKPEYPVLIIEYCSNGNLSNYLINHKADKTSLITQVASALVYLHSQNIVHGDVKGSNILINNHLEACLADFGFASSVETQVSGNETISHIENAVGSVACDTEQVNHITTHGWRWRAPELFADCPDATASICAQATTAIDVYAFAMTVVETYTGSVPFSHIRNDARVVIAVLSGERPERERCPQINDDVWKILKHCWDADPVRRLTMDNVLLSPSFCSNNSSAERARL